MTNTENKPLIASEGKVLTDGNIYSKRIFLGCNSSASNYHEITEEEYAEILASEERLGDDG